MQNFRRFFKKGLEGFSLIEISMVILIMGIMSAAMLKGKDLINNANIKSVASDFERIEIAHIEYVNAYGEFPGDDSSASEKFSGVSNGNGDGEISKDDADKVFGHLFAAGLIPFKNFKKSKIGGEYKIISQGNEGWITILQNDKAFLTSKQAVALKAKLLESQGNNSGEIIQIPAEIDINDNNQRYEIRMRLN